MKGDTSVPELRHLGVRWAERDAIRARMRESRGVVVFSAESTDSADLLIDTRSPLPDHSAFFFVAVRGGSRSESQHYVLHAPRGAVTRMRCRGRWKATGALVHRASLEASVHPLPDGAEIYPGSRQLERSMRSFIEGILEEPAAPSTIEQYAIAQLLTEMGTAVLLDRNGLNALRRTPRQALRDRALAYIVQRCDDPSLTPEEVARDAGVSLRKLQAVFAEHDSSLGAEIRRQRGRRAHSLLSDGRYATLSVDEIAAAAGFRSTMSLRRALLEGYDTTPGAVRRVR